MSNETTIYRGRSIVWPSILIGLGVLLLLENLDLLPINIMALIFRMWPLILIALGIDLLFGRKAGWGPAISAAIVLAVFAGGYWIVQVTGTALTYSGDTYTQDVEHALAGAESAEVKINFGVGKLDLSALENAGNFVEGSLVLIEDQDLIDDYQVKNDVAYYELDSEFDGAVSGYFPGSFFNDFDGDDLVWELQFTDSISLDLNINTGVGRSVIDLTGLQITSLDVSAGVGETIVIMPATGDFSAHISGGVGSIQIRIPEGIAVRVRGSAGIGEINVFGDHQFQNGSYTSDDYNEAENKIDIDVSGGIGEIDIRWDK